MDERKVEEEKTGRLQHCCYVIANEVAGAGFAL